ncbi:hypothetical protein FOYG_03934 [Fusarium oxysporum NRRL 32931]|uniref:HD domain-containing protein n=1 Tax=Fusarium oxysporum NRRL 32931 TaxID=660029 RepID=W9J5E8_FUSOX|nr:hypothetical protein FOYG_03934 [Fusarium oxysporum NRRL 32931]
MVAKAWRPAGDWHTISNSDPEWSHSLRHTVIEMQKFKALLKEREPDDGNWRRLQLLITLAHDLTRLESSTPADEQFERIRLLRDYKLWLPINSLLAGKDLSNTLMVNAYTYTVALHAQRRMTQEYIIDLGVDLPYLLEEGDAYKTIYRVMR